MPFNGAGTFTLVAGNPVVTGTVISSTVQNNTTSDFATGFTNCITRDGQSPPTASLPMGSQKHTGAAAATATGQYMTYGQAINGTTGTFAGAVTGITDLTTTGNTILGEATTDTLNVGANGLVKDASGNIGIGTASPGGKLDVIATGTLIAFLRSGLSTGAADFRLYNDQNSGARAMYNMYTGSAFAGVQLTSGPTGEQGVLATSGAFPLTLGTSNTARLGISSGGNVDVIGGTGKLYIGGQPALSTYTNSGWAINSSYSLGHSQARQADEIQVTLQCLTAEAGYSIGDRVKWNPLMTGYTGGYTVDSTTTQLQIYLLNATVQLPNKSTGAATSITPANWQLRMAGIWL